MFLTIWLKNFFCVKTPMGTPLDSKFFTHKKIFQLPSLAQGGIQIKNYFGKIKDLSIWFFGNEGVLVCQNSYGHIMVWSSFSSDFFVFVRSDQKVASYWLVSVTMHKNCMKISKMIVCQVFKDIPSSQEDINFHMRISVIWKFIRRLKWFRLYFRGK